MASFGEYAVYDGLIYRIVAVSADATPTYTLEPVRKSEETLSKTITSSQVQTFLIPSGGDDIASVALDDITVIGSRTATARTLAEGYVRVKFDSQDGTAVASQVIKKGGKAEDVADPTREHYTFGNWYYTANGSGNAVNFAVDTFDDDTTLYASWVIDTFTFTFDSNEGSAVSAQTIDYGDVAVEPADPTLDANTFDGWFTDDSTFLEAYDFATVVTENVTVYAKWSLT